MHIFYFISLLYFLLHFTPSIASIKTSKEKDEIFKRLVWYQTYFVNINEVIGCDIETKESWFKILFIRNYIYQNKYIRNKYFWYIHPIALKPTRHEGIIRMVWKLINVIYMYWKHKNNSVIGRESYSEKKKYINYEFSTTEYDTSR